jgi:hypothetical protein
MKRWNLAAAFAVALAACSNPPPAPAPAAPPAPVAAPAPPAEPPKAGPAPKVEATPKVELASAHAKVGDAKCRMCHKLQHDSWSASPHAKKGLDCEGCHGGGADFTRVMRDRTAAIAAGLVLPKREFCKGCHKADWQDPMYLRVHAHQAK